MGQVARPNTVESCASPRAARPLIAKNFFVSQNCGYTPIDSARRILYNIPPLDRTAQTPLAKAPKAMKVSLITACRNSAETIASAMDSVFDQTGVELDYIVVDGGSTDATLSLIKEYEAKSGGRMRHISEPDKGMYDAINKGLRLATGEIIGILNADDVLETPETLSHIAAAFTEGVEAVYADIRFVSGADGLAAMRRARTVRYCSAAHWRPWMFRFGAMVPHPSFYARRECFERLGGYSLDYRICSDFELELRFLYLERLRTAYIRECVVAMRLGGTSTANWHSNVLINEEDLRALRAHGIWSCLALIYLKYPFKIWGFVFRSGHSASRMLDFFRPNRFKGAPKPAKA